MEQALQVLGIDHMSVADRAFLVQEIRGSIVVETGQLLLSNALGQRLVEDDAAPGDVTSWEVVKAEAQSRWQLARRLYPRK